MEKLNLKQIQKYELEILNVFDEYCKENNLNYSLAAGTLIGAVRHGRMIPWDDDIDLFMLRKEYNQFYELIKDTGFLPGSRYQVITCEEPNGFLPFIKIVDSTTIAYEEKVRPEFATGIWIDIFPLDYCGNTQEDAEKNCRRMQNIVKKYYRYFSRYTGKSARDLLKNFYVWFINKFRKTQKNTLKEILLSVENEEEEEFIGTIIWANDLKDVYPSRYFKEYDKILFYGAEYSVFKNYDEILRWRFGDYMKIPKEQDRKGHGIKAYKI